MGEWIEGRGINGEYGYINIKTGEFRTTLPNSKEEKAAEKHKYNQAMSKTHASKLAKFNQTEGKLRNHSDEIHKKEVNRPIIAVNPDGTYYNTYIRALAPHENSMQIESPEFDILMLGASMAGSAIEKGAANIARYTSNVEKRAVETAMRTTKNENPLSEMSVGFRQMLQGINGGKTRLFHIGDYILTGRRVGPKGYYNSLAPFRPSINKPGLKNSIKTFIHPEGTSSAYTGFIKVNNAPEQFVGNDVIDAFLYEKTIDPRYGLHKVEPEYGIHTDYVNKWYPNKKIQVYEVQNSLDIPAEQVTSQSKGIPTMFPDKSFSGNGTHIYDASGHLQQTGIYNGRTVRRRQDIWKFNPPEYKQKWFEHRSSYTQQPLWKKKLLDFGLRRVDKIGTPIIVRTKWIYGD